MYLGKTPNLFALAARLIVLPDRARSPFASVSLPADRLDPSIRIGTEGLLERPTLPGDDAMRLAQLVLRFALPVRVGMKLDLEVPFAARKDGVPENDRQRDSKDQDRGRDGQCPPCSGESHAVDSARD